MSDNDTTARRSSYEPNHTIGEVAQRWLVSVADKVRAGELDRSDLYGVERVSAVRYVLASGGPGCDITFVLRGTDVDYAVLDYVEPNGRAQATVSGMVAEDLYEAFKAAERSS